jgi:hypothetical protein
MKEIPIMQLQKILLQVRAMKEIPIMQLQKILLQVRAIQQQITKVSLLKMMNKKLIFYIPWWK